MLKVKLISYLRKSVVYNKNILVLIFGSVLSQLIPILVMPILTRIYMPEDFGILSLYVSCVTIVSVFVTGQYPLAIVLPKKCDDAINLAALSFLLTLFFTTVLLLVIIFLSNQLFSLGLGVLGGWIYFIPFSVLLMGVFNIANYFNIRAGCYKDIARANILKAVALSASQLSIGLIKSGGAGLVTGQIFSQLFANAKLIHNIFKFTADFFSKIQKAQLLRVAFKYNRFPKYTLFAVLCNTLSFHLLSVLIVVYYSIHTLGLYALTIAVVGLPSSLIAQAIGQVFFKEAAKEKQETGCVHISFYGALKKLIILGVIIYSILFIVSTDFFPFVFGQKWELVGYWVKILTPLYFMSFVVGVLTPVNQVNLRNKLGMLWQFGLLVLYVISFLFSNYFLFEFESLLYLLSFVISLWYIFFLFLMISHVNQLKPKKIFL